MQSTHLHIRVHAWWPVFTAVIVQSTTLSSTGPTRNILSVRDTLITFRQDDSFGRSLVTAMAVSASASYRRKLHR